MKKHLFIIKPILLAAIFGCAFWTSAYGFQMTQQIKQSPEVIEAYDVCRRFQQILGENLDFSRAYEATFSKDAARRRAIAIIDGELGNVEDFKDVSDELLIDAYKQRMQIFYLMVALIGAKGKAPVSTFPNGFEEVLKRAAPNDPKEFAKFVDQLKKDTMAFRAHFDNLVARYPAVAEEVQKFKTEMISDKFAPPTTYEVLPIRGYYRSQVLYTNEDYYTIDGYSLIKEQEQMRIIGIRFLTRLF